MELWIRNQNRETLELTTYLQIIYMDELDTENKWVIEGGSYLGYYKTKERALEVLDEIQGKLQNKFLCKPICILKAKDIDRAENLLNFKYKNEKFIMQPQAIDIVPINCDIVIYEMPKE